MLKNNARVLLHDFHSHDGDQANIWAGCPIYSSMARPTHFSKGSIAYSINAPFKGGAYTASDKALKI